MKRFNYKKWLELRDKRHERARKKHVKVTTSLRTARKLMNAAKGFEVHHIDGNPFNNDISNLITLTRKQHCFAHSLMGKIKYSAYLYRSI